MKTFYLTLLALFMLTAFVSRSFAQDEDKDDDPMTSESQTTSQFIQGGISVGYLGYGYLGTRSGFSLPVSATYERYFSEHISGGAFIGYTSYKYDYTTYSFRRTFLNFGPRASYHYTHILNDVFELGVNPDQFDFYVSLMLLLESRSSSAEINTIDSDNDFVVGFGGVMGVRYKFNENLAVFGETGRGNFGYLTAGLAYYF